MIVVNGSAMFLPPIATQLTRLFLTQSKAAVGEVVVVIVVLCGVVEGGRVA